MYYPVNNTSNCSIFNKSLFQDLENYELNLDSNNNLHILYNNETINDNNKIDFNISNFINSIDDSTSTTNLNVWQPALIQTSNYINNKLILDKTTIDNPIFGIDKALSFTPKFKNWEIEELNSSSPAKMVCNWHVNSIYGGLEINYGVLFWYKFTDYGANASIPYSGLPNGVKFRLDNNVTHGTDTIPAQTPLIKFNNEYIKRLDSNTYIIDSSTDPNNRSNPIRFNENTQKKLVPVSEISQQSLLEQCKLFKDSTFTIKGKNVDLFISNGECFSYYYGLSDKLRNNTQNMPSRTYLSPVLSKIYREIYHRLTLYSVKKNTPSLSLSAARLLQKLCYFLSTSPLMDMTTIDILSDKRIYDEVQKYINNTTNLSDINNEITTLLNIINFIHKNYTTLFNSDNNLEKYGLSNYIYKQTLFNNYVSNKKDLFKALTNKYGCGLLISGNTKLKYKNKLINGAHALLTTNSLNWRPKTLQNNTASYNNTSIKIGDLTYATNISATGSVINIRSSSWTTPQDNIQIPLADISLKKDKAAPLYLGSGIYQDINNINNNNETVFVIEDIFKDDSISSQTIYFWEQVGGPRCLRFDNISKDKFKTRRFLTSNVDAPNVYVRSSGTYSIKCTRFDYKNKESDFLTLTTDNTLSLPNITVSKDITSYPKIMTSNIKSIGFHKKGMVYIIDSDHYVDTGKETDMDDIPINGIIKLKDIKLDLNAVKPVNISESPVDLVLQYDTTGGNSLVSLLSIGISNVRDDKYKYGQCTSFYQEKIKRKRSVGAGYSPSELGSSDFYREIFVDEYSFKYHNLNGRTGSNAVNLRTPSTASTKFAPPVLSYGGYGSGIVDMIGIKIPGHPNPTSGLLYPVSGLLYQAPSLLPSIKDSGQIIPNITDRTNILPTNYDILCHLKEIRPSGTGYYTEFSKGHFHPISGWIDDSSLYGKSNVVIHKPELQKSYHFKGIGFSSLNNIPNGTGTGINIYTSTISLKAGLRKDLQNNINVYGSYRSTLNCEGIDVSGPEDIFSDNLLTTTIQDSWTYTEGNSSTDCGNTKVIYGLLDDIASRTIKSIDIKLNFLNHPNPKNLAIWLDVTNDNLPNSVGIASSSGDIFLYNPNQLTLSNKINNEYLQNIKTNNNGVSISGLKLYLLNQQHISNYCSNFSINFTDNANKFTITDKSLYDDILQVNETLSNNGSILPTLGAVTGVYNDIDINRYGSSIRNNSINDINNYLIKFSGLPLSGTNITLNIANIEPIEYDNINILDNIINNNTLSDIAFVDRKKYSTIKDTSLCSWSAIIHTDINKNKTDNILNYIDYHNSISGYFPTSGLINTATNQYYKPSYSGNYSPVNGTGYDFMGRFSAGDNTVMNKNFMVPLVNINAPYSYLYNLNHCFYDDGGVDRFRSALQPQFPSLLGYQGGPGGNISSLVSLFQSGGRNDPIVNFFISVRASQLNALTSSQFYKPIYSAKNYGSPTKVAVAISADGAVWYDTEVPIFKYSNTPLIHKNIYKYIKLNSSIPKDLDFLYKFPFTILKESSQLNLANVVAKISNNIQTKNGELTIDNIPLKNNDIVYAQNQTTASDNGYWIVGTGTWSRCPPSPITDELSIFFTYNTLDSQFLKNPIDNNIKNNIMIDGIRPYHFFDIDETIEFSEPPGTTSKIIGKSIISTKYGQKTVLTLETAPSKDSKIFKSDSNSNLLFLYKDDYIPTGIYLEKDVSFNMWAIDSSESFRIKSDIPQMKLSCIGEGSVGWGTDQIYAETLSKLDISNGYNDYFDNTINDLYKTNNLTLIPYSGASNIYIQTDINTPTKDRIKACSYSLNDTGLSFNNHENNKYNDDNNINKLYHKLNSYAQQNIKNKVILELKSDKFKSTTIPNSGFISIDNDNLFYKSIKFKDNDINTLNNRLVSLSSSGTNDFNPSTVIDALNISNINDMIKYYNYLVADSGECFQPTGYRPQNLVCNKQKAYTRLQDLYNEKNQIQIALSCNNSGINIPHISGKITNNLPTGINIEYIENSDLYWIHIDPNRPCRLNDELTIKILVTGSTYTFPMNVDNIIPQNSISSYAGQQIFQPFAGPNNNPQLFATADIGFIKDGIRVNHYVVPQAKIDAQKNLIQTQYPSLSWTDDEVFIYGKSSSENDLSNSKKIMLNDGTTSNDYIVQLREQYIRPANLIKYSAAISGVIDFNKNTIKIKFKNLPRKLKSVDSESFDRYVYDYEGNLVKDLSPASSVGQLANNFVCWQCFNDKGIYITGIPPYFIMANEMRYRAFFGSIDGIEHKNTLFSDSKEDWEWIPFEYYN